MNNKMRPALIGGVVLGLLSSIPFVNLVNTCCCAWVLMGGALAAYLYIKQSPTPVTPGEAAQVGLLAGVVGTVLLFVVGIPLGLVAGDAMNAMLVKFFEGVNPQAAEAMRQAVEQQQNMPLSQRLPQMIGFSLMNAVVTILFATLGGLLGVAIFEKRKGAGGGTMSAPPPPPPPGFGGPPATPGFGGPMPPPPTPPAQQPSSDFGGNFGAGEEGQPER